MERTAGFLTGAGAGAAALALLARSAAEAGDASLASLGAAAVLLLQGIVAGRRTLPTSPTLLGGAAGLMVALRLVPQAGAVAALGVGVALAGAGLLLSVAPGAAGPSRPAIPAMGTMRTVGVIGAGLALVLSVRAVTGDVLRVTGADLESRVFALVPLLLAAGLAAAAAEFLVARHRGLGRWLPALLAAGALAAWLGESRSLGDLFALAERIQGPSVTRRHYLYGVSLLAGAAGGAWIACLGALSGATATAVPAGRARAGVALGWIAVTLLEPSFGVGPVDVPGPRTDPVRTHLVLEEETPGWPLAAAPPPKGSGDDTIVIELGERTFDELRLLARRAVERLDAPVGLLDGRRLVLRSGPDAAALSAEAVAALAAEAGRARDELLLLRPARTRLAAFRADLASRNLRRLLRRADRLDALGGPPVERLRLELCAAILADDHATEDRVLDRLERGDPRDARRLREERAVARERLHAFLLAARDADPSDADVRHRLGRIDVATGRTLAGLAELTRALELRPKLLAAGVDLMEAYLAAEAEGLHRWSAGGSLLPNVATARAAHRQIQRELVEPEEVARANVAMASVLLLEARDEEDPAAAEARRREAFARANLALLRDATDPDAHRLVAEALLARGIRPRAAFRHASDAARLWPHDPRNHRAALRTATTPAERRQALAKALANGLAVELAPGG